MTEKIIAAVAAAVGVGLLAYIAVFINIGADQWALFEHDSVGWKIGAALLIAVACLHFGVMTFQVGRPASERVQMVGVLAMVVAGAAGGLAVNAALFGSVWWAGIVGLGMLVYCTTILLLAGSGFRGLRAK